MRRAAALIPLLVLPWALAADGAVKPRTVLILPFDATALEPEARWWGDGIAKLMELGFVHHPAIAQIDTGRVRSQKPEAWTDAPAIQAARATRVDAAIFGRVTKRGTDFVLEPKLVELRAAAADVTVLEPIIAAQPDILGRLATLPVIYVRTLKIPLTDAEARRIERAASPTRSLRAFEYFARGQMAADRGTQEGNEQAVDLLSRAIEVDPTFAVAQYSRGTVHQTLGNRWKAQSDFRAATQLDAGYAEPFKALGDLYLTQPRRLFDQAIEHYGKAIELRPYYADAHVGLGDARAAKGDVDGAIGAYQKALVLNTLNPRVHMSLGKIYYGEKGLYYEAVTAYQKAIELDPGSIEARMGLGEVYEDKGLYKEAVEEYKRVVERDPKHTGAMYNLALVYEKLDPREAIAQWERYITVAGPLQSEKDWVDVARQHLRKLKSQIKD
ncbi:MAG: tetratricopeptide repeat protein [Candidatus Rokuibacteriota bacterium]